MNLQQTSEKYKKNTVTNALPEELTLMLFDGAVRFINESYNSLINKNYERSNEFSIKTQKIIREFMLTLDMKYEMSKDLFKLYDYILFRLVESNRKKDLVMTEETRDMIIDLRDTWKKAMPR